MLTSYLKHISWAALLAAATAFAQATPPAAPDAPEAPETPKVKPRTPKPPKPPKARTYVFSTDEGGSSYLGVGVRDVTSDTVKSLNLRDERGVEVTSIDQDGPAAKAGVKEHDVILSFNGENVESYEQLRRMIRETPAGRKVKLGLSRNGQPLNLETTLGKREDTFTLVKPNVVIPKINIPPMTWDWESPGFAMLQMASRSGVTVEDLTPQLGEYFGAKGGDGVLVRSVERGSPAESAGLKAGDVIIKVNNESISNAGEWRRVMRQQKTGAAVPLTILRDKREQNVSLKVPERKSSDAAFQFAFPDNIYYDVDSSEIEKMINQQLPAIKKSSYIALTAAQKSLLQQQKELQKQIDRSMREMQRELRNIRIETD
jgi:C-terminal processing protease CtpA/Prc